VIRYHLEIFAQPAEPRRRVLLDALNGELRRLGMHRTVTIAVTEPEPPPPGEPSIGVYFGDPVLAGDPRVTERVAAALSADRAVIPVVDDLAGYLACVPACLHQVNGLHWGPEEAGLRLARTVLEGLGIEERDRRVFISHKRDDGLAVAEQLHEELARHGFFPFIDRFHIRPGRDVHAEIAGQLEDCAVLLLVETPLAHASDWVFDEVNYALSHHLGLHIVAWPGPPEQVPGTDGLLRQQLLAEDIVAERGFGVLSAKALEQVILNVEAEHARALVRRRSYLLTSVTDAAREAGLECVPMPGWGATVNGPAGPTIVRVVPRMPTVDDLYELDRIRTKFPGSPPGVLIHAPRRIPPAKRDILAWAGEFRQLTLVPENAIGGFWRRSDVG
jgi:hypothetical protein